jgi:hypothetical protein
MVPAKKSEVVMWPSVKSLLGRETMRRRHGRRNWTHAALKLIEMGAGIATNRRIPLYIEAASCSGERIMRSALLAARLQTTYADGPRKQGPQDKETVNDESQGIRLAEMQALVHYWGNGYNWRNGEAKLNTLPEFVTTIDGVDIQFIHVRSREPNALPLILTHGWPGSPLEYLKVIGPLTDPVADGGSAQDAFDVVVPTIPGYGFSGKPTDLGWNPDRVARAWDVLMKRLGYTRYVAGWRSRLGHFRRTGAPGATRTARHPSHHAGHDSREPGGGHQQRRSGAHSRLNVSLPGLEREVAQSLVDAAHQTYPYSKATRGNVDVASTWTHSNQSNKQRRSTSEYDQTVRGNQPAPSPFLTECGHGSRGRPPCRNGFGGGIASDSRGMSDAATGLPSGRGAATIVHRNPRKTRCAV